MGHNINKLIQICHKIFKSSVSASKDDAVKITCRVLFENACKLKIVYLNETNNCYEFRKSDVISYTFLNK